MADIYYFKKLKQGNTYNVVMESVGGGGGGGVIMYLH